MLSASTASHRVRRTHLLCGSQARHRRGALSPDSAQNPRRTMRFPNARACLLHCKRHAIRARLRTGGRKVIICWGKTQIVGWTYEQCARTPTLSVCVIACAPTCVPASSKHPSRAPNTSPPAMTMRMFALTISGVRINASVTLIEYTSARHVNAVAHTDSPPSKRHAKLARKGGRARVCITCSDGAVARAVA